jgi:hypothetical protein
MRELWRRGKAGIALSLFSVIVISYAVYIWTSESQQTVKENFEDISIFVPIAGVIVGIIIGIGDLIMLLSDWYYDNRIKRIAKAKAEGMAEYHATVAEWNIRRLEAEAKGEKFTEPLPSITGSNSNSAKETASDHNSEVTIIK